MKYEELNFKIPQESSDYSECSDFAISSIEQILGESLETGENKIVINTNLKFGLPMENINKIAGPFVEAWAFETFELISDDPDNKYQLINCEALKRLNRADILLQFSKERENESGITSEVDVKSTSDDVEDSGKSPNITSFARIRSAYIDEPDILFIILSLKHSVYSKKNPETKLMDGIMEVTDYNAYDIKFLSSPDINYNPALGTGQIQISDIHYVTEERRTAWDFCQLLDKKYLASSKNDFEDWLSLARKHKWIKEDE